MRAAASGERLTEVAPALGSGLQSRRARPIPRAAFPRLRGHPRRAPDRVRPHCARARVPPPRSPPLVFGERSFALAQPLGMQCGSARAPPPGAAAPPPDPHCPPAARLRRSDDFARQPQSPRDRESVALANRVRLESIKRRQALGIEINRRRLEARPRVRVQLDRRRMGRDGHQAVAHRPGNPSGRSPAPRPRPGPCRRPARRESPVPVPRSERIISRQIRDMRGEARQAGLDRLRIADIGENAAKHLDLAAALRPEPGFPPAPSARTGRRS